MECLCWRQLQALWRHAALACALQVAETQVWGATTWQGCVCARARVCAMLMRQLVMDQCTRQCGCGMHLHANIDADMWLLHVFPNQLLVAQSSFANM